MNALGVSLAQLEDRMAKACRAASRPRTEVELMAVSKTFPAEAILEAASLGLMLYGENRVQEFAAKAVDATAMRERATNPALRFHLIGHLQSNKALRAAEIFDAIDSVDSLKLAQRLNDAAAKLDKKLSILIEVKLSPEESKAGLDPSSAAATELLDALPSLTHLELRGLMTVAPLGVPDGETRACFRSLGEWRGRWAQQHPRLSFNVLSMGMSGDFELAIAEGATRIRIGSALFGARFYAAASTETH
jgi:hypothetical protein